MYIEKIVFIGAGNVATHLSQAIKDAGFRIRQVYSRSIDSAQSLANKLKCGYTTDIKAVKKDADVYFFTVPDDALPEILNIMPPNNGLWVHTAGSVPMEVFHGHAKRYGVMYPLQTFSKQREIDLFDVPFFIEANTFDDMELLDHIAGHLSDTSIYSTSEQRKYIHLAAVFACNFSNHIYALAAQILQEKGINRRLLQPLLFETISKLYDMPPVQAQTGPAVRGDHAIMEQHLTMLKDEQMRKIYSLISENIHTYHINNKRQ